MRHLNIPPLLAAAPQPERASDAAAAGVAPLPAERALALGLVSTVADDVAAAAEAQQKRGWAGLSQAVPATLARRWAALEAVAQLLRRTADLAGVKFQCATEEGAITMARDALQQVLLNLTLNAIEATPAGGRISLSNRPVAGPGAGRPPATGQHDQAARTPAQ